MSDNPLEDDPAREARIKARAYHLWEADGGPHGRHDEYWERASELVRMEEAGNPGQLPNPATLPGADPMQDEPVEEASIQENLGEFPDRFADQGESEPTPKAKRSTTRSKLAETPSTGAAGPAADKAISDNPVSDKPAATRARKPKT